MQNHNVSIRSDLRDTDRFPDTNEYAIRLRVPLKRARRIHVVSAELGPVDAPTLAKTDDAEVVFDEPFLIDCDADRNITPVDALGMKWHLFRNQVASVNTSTTSAQGDLALMQDTVTVAEAGMPTTWPPRIARWVGGGGTSPGSDGKCVVTVTIAPPLDPGTAVVLAFGDTTTVEYHVVQVVTSSDTTITVIGTALPSADTVDVYILDGGVSTVQAHLNRLLPTGTGTNIFTTVAPHGAQHAPPGSAHGIGPIDTITAFGLVDVTAPPNTSHLTCPGTARNTLADVVAHQGVGLDVTFTEDARGGTYTLGGAATHVVVPRGNTEMNTTVGWLLGLRAGATVLPVTRQCPVGYFRRPLDPGSYSGTTLRDAVNRAGNPASVSESIVHFHDSQRYVHRIIVRAGRYVTVTSLLHGITAAMKRAEQLAHRTLPNYTLPNYTVISGEVTGEVPAIRNVPSHVRLFFPPASADLAWRLGVDEWDGFLDATQVGRLEFPGPEVRRRATLGAGGAFAALAGTWPRYRYPVTRRMLDHELPRRRRYAWRARPVESAPTTATHDGDLRVDIADNNVIGEKLNVRSHRVTATRDKGDGNTWTVTTIVPVGVQSGDIVQLEGVGAVDPWRRIGVVLDEVDEEPPDVGSIQDVTNKDIPREMGETLTGTATVVEGDLVIKGINTLFLTELVGATENHPATLFMQGVGIFTVTGAPTNDTLDLKDASASEGAGPLVLLRSAAAARYGVKDGSAWAVAVGDVTDITGTPNNGVRIFEPLETRTPWTPGFLGAALQQRLGFAAWGTSPNPSRIVHKAVRDIDVGPARYVLLCLALPTGCTQLDSYEASERDQSSAGLVVLGKFVFGRGMVASFSATPDTYFTLDTVHVSLRNPDFSLFDSRGIANSLTLGVTCDPVDSLFTYAPSTSERVYTHYTT